MESRKEKGQYMTPEKIVVMILDDIGYAGDEVLTKKIMEPSFGDGAFLSEIIKRIIKEGRKQSLSKEEISDIIQDNVFGIEKDEKIYKKAIGRLNGILEEYKIPKIEWKNLINGDTLIEWKKHKEKYDYVVGNPPFVRIHNIPEGYRGIVKSFQFSDGMADLYVIFYEIGINMLGENGKLGFISPNTFIRNASQQKFRDFLIKNKYISAIYDFGASKIFPDADTYTCICLIGKEKEKKNIKYKEYNMYLPVSESVIDFEYLKNNMTGHPWNFGSDDDMKFLKEINNRPKKISDIVTVQNGIVTNRDYIYIIQAYTDKELTKPYTGKGDSVYFNVGRKIPSQNLSVDKTLCIETSCVGLNPRPKSGNETEGRVIKDKAGKVHEIESSILRRCVKASKYEGKADNTYIIFPYAEAPISEDRLKKEFPKTYAYLDSFRDELAKRDMDKNADWFLFGRSQGIQNSGLKKIVFKHIIDKNKPQIKPFILDEDIVVYSGRYITAETEEDLQKAYNIFKSEEFARYCALVGKNKSGGYVEVSTKAVKEFGVDIEKQPSVEN